MESNIVMFPTAKMTTVDSGLLTDEERIIAAENLVRVYAEQAAREAAHRGDARELTLDQFAARVNYLQRKQQPTTNADGVHIGDLFYGSWGYEQTNVDFFQVVGLKGKHTAILRRIAGDYIGGYAMQGNVRPCRDDFAGEEEYTVRTKLSDFYNPPCVILKHPTATGHSLSPIDDDHEVGYSSYY